MTGQLSVMFYTRYGLRSLRRGGQRTFLALVCIAFGVMSLVAMISLGNLFTGIINKDPRIDLGGDLWVGNHEQPLTTAQIGQLAQLQQSGQFQRYTLVSGTTATLLLKPNGTGHAYFLGGKAFGIDPTVYPLVGSFTLRNNTQPLAQVLTAPDSAMLTRDIADQLNLKIGDSFTLSSLSSLATRFQVSAIADRTPDNSGGAVYFTTDGARRLGLSPLWGLALLPSAAQSKQPTDAVAETLKDSGLDVTASSDISGLQQSQAVSLFTFMFKGAGILGLIIGGIGVVNTLQVILARRTLEIAVLKTVGYRERDLLALFGMELLLLGLSGSLIGAVGAIGLSALLVGLLSQSASLLIYWQMDGGLLLGGIVTGLATTLIFGTFAIIQASGVRPAVLLRALPRRLTVGGILNTIGLFVLLTAVFTALCSIVMGSIISGLEIVLISFAGLIGLGLVFGIVLFVVVRLPMPRLGVLSLARNNLKRQRFRAIYAMIALFVGVFTIGFASMVISSASARFSNHGIGLGGDNLAIQGQLSDQPAISAQLNKLGLTPSVLSCQTQAQVIVQNNTVPLLVDGRTELPADLTLTGSAWGSVPDGVWVPEKFPLTVGSALIINTVNGAPVTLHIAGTYATAGPVSLSDQGNTLVVSKDMALTIGGNSTGLLVVIAAPVEQLTALSNSLGQALPTMTVISLADLNNAVQRNINNFFLLAIGVAGLALVAGAVLIANSVGLAMVERRREMGILKAVGYNSRAVFGTIMIEQGLLGILGGIIGMAAVALAITLLNNAQSSAHIVFSLPQAALMIGVAMLIALGSAGLVAWSPTHQRPLTVLRDE